MNEEGNLELEEINDDIINSEELKIWEGKQRELLTSTVDYNLGSIAALKLDLSPKYQRRHRWDKVRQSKLIESFLMNVPVPPIFLNEDEYGKYSIIDGKQRVSSIKAFLQNELKLEGLQVFHELNGKYFNDLPAVFQEVIQTRPNLRAIIILRQSDRDIKHEVFQRLNTGGVKLNPQEIRNNAYPGLFSELLLELSMTPSFHKLLGIRNKENSKIYKEMKDVEFVLRYFTLVDKWTEYKGNMKLTLDNFLEDHRNLGEEDLEKFRTRFTECLTKVSLAFGDNAFKRWVPEQSAWRNQPLASLIDAQLIAVDSYTISDLQGKEENIINNFKELFIEGTDFRKAIDSATNNSGPLNARIQICIDTIHKSIR